MNELLGSSSVPKVQPAQAYEPLPSTLPSLIPFPRCPFQPGEMLQKRSLAVNASKGYGRVEILKTDPEYAFVLALFNHKRPPGMRVTSMHYLFNKSLLNDFATQLSQMDDRLSIDRQSVADKYSKHRWKTQTDLFPFVELQVADKIQKLSNVKVLPLWQATDAAKANVINEHGFVYCGRLQQPIAGVNYFTNSARHAALHSKGRALLMAWVALKESNLLPIPDTGQMEDEFAVEWPSQALPQFYVEFDTDPQLNAQLVPQPESTDVEGHYFGCFQEAFQRSDLLGQLYYLEQLALLFLDKQKHSDAVQLINTALKVAKDNKLDSSHQRLANLLEEIEYNFLTETLGIKLPGDYKTSIWIRRERLARIRAVAQLQLEQSEPASSILPLLTQNYRNLIRVFIEESLSLLPPPPTKFAVFLLGSGARIEICPYSNAQFGFWLENASEENKAYFRRLAQMVELQFLLLGETNYKILHLREKDQTWKAKSILSDGCRIDIGGLAPSGKTGIYELIGSPEELALFQRLEWMSKHDGETLLSSAMIAPALLMGEEKLLKDYQSRIQEHLKDTHQDRAMDLLKRYIEEWQPSLTEEQVKRNAFNVVKDLYYPLQMIIEALALYYRLESIHTMDRIGELEKRRVFSKKGANNLRKAFEMALTLRIRLQLFFQEQNEEMSRTPRADGERYYLISEGENADLIELHRILIPFYRASIDFLKGNSSSFSKSIFYLKNLENEKPDLQITTKDITADKKALALRALELSKEEHKEPHLSTMACLNALGDICTKDLKEHEQGRAYYRQAHSLGQQILDKAKSDLPELPKDAGIPTIMAFYGLYRFKIVPKLNKELYKIMLEYGRTLEGLGDSCFACGEDSAALEAYKAFLDMHLFLTKSKPTQHVASCYFKMGRVYKSMGDPTLAEEYYEKALSVAKSLSKMDDFKKTVKEHLKELNSPK